MAKKVILDIGYDNPDLGCDGNTCEVINVIGKQSEDIAQGVNEGEGEDPEQGAGDQGLMFGYATNETEVLMPAPITYSHRLVEQQAFMRKNKQAALAKARCQKPGKLLYEMMENLNLFLLWSYQRNMILKCHRMNLEKGLWKKL